jgi:hypothetical protein
MEEVAEVVNMAAGAREAVQVGVKEAEMAMAEMASGVRALARAVTAEVEGMAPGAMGMEGVVVRVRVAMEAVAAGGWCRVVMVGEERG